MRCMHRSRVYALLIDTPEAEAAPARHPGTQRPRRVPGPGHYLAVSAEVATSAGDPRENVVIDLDGPF